LSDREVSLRVTLTLIMEGVAIRVRMGGSTHAEVTLASRLLAALVISWQCSACGGSTRTGAADLPAAGSTSERDGAGGSETDRPGVSEGLPSSGGTPVGGSTAGAGGSVFLGGAGGMVGTAGVGAETGGAGGTGGAAGAPSKIILFDGSSESFKTWVSVRNQLPNPWQNNGDGTMTVASTTGDIRSKQQFQNVFVHLEYLTPQTHRDRYSELDSANGDVFLNESYGLRITDSYGLLPTAHSCGAVFGYHAPLEVACHELGLWNTYEIEFQAPTCDGDYPTRISTPARFVEVKLNGTLIHRNVDVLQQTQAGLAEGCEPRGLRLQDYAGLLPLSFRNIWAIPRLTASPSP
jgi:hypothetical protein